MKQLLYFGLENEYEVRTKQWKKDYKKYQRKLAEEQKRYELEAEVYRTVKLSGFGIFNFDKLRRRENTLAITTFFEFEGKTDDLRFGPNYIYCFPGDNKTVITLNTRGNGKLYLDPREKHFRMLAVLDSNRVAVFSSKKYQEIDFNALSNSQFPTYTFVLETRDGNISSKADLEKLLNI